MGRRKSRTRIAILGGGATGLSAAYHAAKRGADVDVYEERDEVGGVLRSAHVDSNNKDSFAYDLGAVSMQMKHPTVAKLIEDLKIPVHIRPATASASYVLYNGEPVPLPRGPCALATTPLLSVRTKLRVLLEPFDPRRQRKAAASGETVFGFFARRFSPEFASRADDAAVGGIYAAPVATLSMRYALENVWNVERKKGSLIVPMITRARISSEDKSQLRKSVTLAGGMQALPKALSDAMQRLGNGGSARLRTGKRVRRLVRREDGSWRVNGDWARYDAVICALPAHALADVSSNLNVMERGFANLAKLVKYAPVAVSVFGFKRDAVKRDLRGVGLLVPTSESRKGVLGVRFSSEEFADKTRTEEERGLVFLTVYTGGERAPKRAVQPIDVVETGARAELDRMLGVVGEPAFSRTQVWHKGLPQYGFKHDSMLRDVRRLERSVPGLLMAGNYLKGVAVSDALRSGLDASLRALEYVRTLKIISAKAAIDPKKLDGFRSDQ